MNVYVVPAILAFFVKLIVLFLGQRAPNANKVFIFMVMIFAFHNVCEILIFLEVFNGVKSDYLLKVYYTVSIISLLSINCFVASLVDLTKSLVVKVLTPICFVVIILLLTTDLVVIGSVPLAYTVTAMQGQFYWLFQLLSAVLLLSIFAQSYATYTMTSSHITQIRSLYIAIALAPLLIIAFLVMILMNMGFQINGAILFPFATTLFFIITLASEYQHKLTDVRRFLPFSDERRSSNEIMEVFSSYARDDANYRDSVSQIERLLVLHKLNKADGNASLTAEQMGMPRSSLYSIFNRLQINLRD